MKLFPVIIYLIFQYSFGQTFEIEEKIPLSKKLKETSGLIYFNHKIFTFNDGGGKTELYVLEPTTGEIIHKIKIKNAKNVDWESISQDSKYIYIGDTGNNNGNRTNLVIYKIPKKNIEIVDSVKAKKIFFRYEDQYLFFKNKSKTNFDCEAITVYQDQLFIFTKNWGDFKTNIYKIPKSKGKYVAKQISSLDIDCMLTSISYNSTNNKFIGTGYDRKYQPYLIKVSNFGKEIQQLKKINILDELGYVNQIEAIDWKNSSQVFITREASHKYLNKKEYKRKQTMFLISLDK